MVLDDDSNAMLTKPHITVSCMLYYLAYLPAEDDYESLHKGAYYNTSLQLLVLLSANNWWFLPATYAYYRPVQ